MLGLITPAKGDILGIFEIAPETIDEIRSDIMDVGKNTYHFETDLKDRNGEAVARVTKEVYVRLKNSPGSDASSSRS